MGVDLIFLFDSWPGLYSAGKGPTVATSFSALTRMLTPRSISSIDIVRGGHIRILSGPAAPMRRPLCVAKDASLFGVTVADVSRINAQNRPAPIYPATCGGFAVFMVDMSSSPMRFALADKSSSTSTSRAASADEHAMGVAAMVDPILIGLLADGQRQDGH